MERAGKRRFAEKTPRNIRRLDALFRTSRQARFVLFCGTPRRRLFAAHASAAQGRDGERSCRSIPGSRSPVAHRRWRDDHRALAAVLVDPRFLTLRYEDLVREPRPVLEKLMTFVGEAWDDCLLEHAGAGSPFRNVTTFAQNPEALTPMNTSALSRWERDLDAKDRRIFKRIAGPLLIELGYARDLDW